MLNTAKGVSAANTQVNASNIDNLSDAVICAFLASQPNNPQLAHEDLQQIHPDDLRDDLDMANDYIRLGEAEVFEEYRALKNQDYKNKESTRRTVFVENSHLTKLWCQIVDNCKKGLGYNAVPPPYTGNFMPPTPDLYFTGLDEFVNKLEVHSLMVLQVQKQVIMQVKLERRQNLSRINILLPLWTADPPYSQDPKSSQEDESKPLSAQNKDYVVGGKTSIKLSFDPNMPALEDYNIFDSSRNDEDDGAEADMNNLDTTIYEEPTKDNSMHEGSKLDRAMQEELLTIPIVKTASTSIETQKPLLKDENGEEVDVRMYRSMISSLMYLHPSRLTTSCSVCLWLDTKSMPKVSHLHAVKRILDYYPRALIAAARTDSGWQILQHKLENVA
ncbi:hypothetical protein Tco_0910659 [Tanacetum coccineum]|uniref:Uncharacterized protein n=1 Tax=Tanacetum coccineum TaxID=301880 RepID=A0ABQ5D0N1_9ASTR